MTKPGNHTHTGGTFDQNMPRANTKFLNWQTSRGQAVEKGPGENKLPVPNRDTLRIFLGDAFSAPVGSMR